MGQIVNARVTLLTQVNTDRDQGVQISGLNGVFKSEAGLILYKRSITIDMERHRTYVFATWSAYLSHPRMRVWYYLRYC